MVVPLMMLGNVYLRLTVFIEHTIAESPVPMILLGGLVNLFVWDYLGRSNLHLCSKKESF